MQTCLCHAHRPLEVFRAAVPLERRMQVACWLADFQGSHFVMFQTDDPIESVMHVSWLWYQEGLGERHHEACNRHRKLDRVGLCT